MVACIGLLLLLPVRRCNVYSPVYDTVVFVVEAEEEEMAMAILNVFAQKLSHHRFVRKLI